ncbi:DUF1501 domain-containing protein [Asanoa sp. WMMD1127]|uniref:DUF1501 domain-containing protein n=1 Tax=Asanoa sp. WMMD1127 TaxID=3016107 RepID=UPI002416BAB7|nr:DUF1501 domain-containing protein [Asanoa sp. WMMD1127]MDG4823993.1 DUF1501 domain-containing protein [Asanoa sp. WMMD1127]
MDTLTRRKFLIASGVVGAGALAAGAAVYTLDDILATAGDRPADAGTLVLVTLYGGNDGLNTVVPYADAAYQDARPDIAYDAGEVLRLDDATGLNPALKGFQRLFTEDRLAIVRGVGYPKPDRSHFRSMDIWQTADPVRPGTTGWLGRWLDTAGGDPRLAVSFEPALPPLLAGATSAGAAVPTGARQKATGVTGFGTAVAGEPPLQARAARCFADLERVEAMITEVRAAQESEEDGADEPATGTGGRSDLAGQLDLVAQCVEAGVATRAFSVSLGGFDTHADEKQLQEILLGKVDKAVTGFADRMAGRPVTIAVYSEFGRRVRANASDGTDHGTASNVFVLGNGVRGGLHGEQPSLTDLDDGDLKHTVDFRDVYAGLLDGVLGADPERVLGGWTGKLPLTGS